MFGTPVPVEILVRGVVRRSFVNRLWRFGLSQMQIGHEDQDYRRDDAESQIRVDDREQPAK